MITWFFADDIWSDSQKADKLWPRQFHRESEGELCCIHSGINLLSIGYSWNSLSQMFTGTTMLSIYQFIQGLIGLPWVENICPHRPIFLCHWLFKVLFRDGKCNENAEELAKWKAGYAREEPKWLFWFCPWRTSERGDNPNRGNRSEFDVRATICQLWNNFPGPNFSR